MDRIRERVLNWSLRRRGPFYLGLAAGIVAALICLILAPAFTVAVGANAMFAVYLAVVIAELPRLTPDFLRRRAADADLPVGGIFIVAGLIVLVAVTFLFLALNDAGPLNVVEVALSVISVLLGWFTINAMASLHYAHVYYGRVEEDGEDVAAGLDFPNCTTPGGLDFIYFGFVVGMTAQVSDVVVSSTPMRRLVLTHSVFAFLFNTVLVAATVNVVVAAAGG